MSHYNVMPLQVVFKPSRQLFCALLIAGIAGVIIVASMPLAVWIKLAASLLIIFGTVYFIARDALLALPWSWQRIDLNGKGELSFTTRNGAVRKGTVDSSSFVAAYMTLLNITLEDSRWGRHAVILTDSADSEEFRRLRVWLRWGMPLDFGKTVAEEA